MSRYRIVESVGSRVERVRDYDDLEIHHPSQRGREPGRTYANVQGEREEVLRERTRSGQYLVSKDFVLQDADRPGARVRVPSPVEGVIGSVDASSGLVDIYDRPGGEVLVRIRHMDLRGSRLEVGDRVGYGQPLGWQSGFGGGRPDRYGVHVHFDFNAEHLGRFDRYLRDLDGGVITPDGGRPDRAPHAPATPAPGGARLLESGSRGPDVEQVQRTLIRLGYRDADGRELAADGDFGGRTREAVERFQRAQGLEADGRVGRDTRMALEAASRAPAPVLETSSRGADVERLQRTLARLGYRDAAGRDLVADGDFGRRTREAVEAFQRANGLEVDGRVGRDTSAALAKASGRLLSDAQHLRHALYLQASDAVARMEREHGLPAGPHSERIAGSVCVCASREGLARIDHVELSADRSLVRAVEVSTVRDEAGLNRTTQPIPTVAAAQATLASSSDLLREPPAATREAEAPLLRRAAAAAV